MGRGTDSEGGGGFELGGHTAWGNIEFPHGNVSTTLTRREKQIQFF